MLNNFNVSQLLSKRERTSSEEKKTQNHKTNVNDTIHVKPKSERSAASDEHVVCRTVKVLMVVKFFP
jgi:hypothetical protein